VLSEEKSAIYIYIWTGFERDKNSGQIWILPFIKIRKSLESIFCAQNIGTSKNYKTTPRNVLESNELKQHLEFLKLFLVSQINRFWLPEIRKIFRKT
jgi:hypothetical protein